MKLLGKFSPVLIFLCIVIVYYWKIFFKGHIAMPADLLVGAYFPWLSEKWGMPAGVPVKNPLISDVFSQFFIWKSLIAESFKNLEFPLWNPYSYFGHPLLANFHSGALNPFNFLFVIFGDITGWNFYVIFQRLLSAVSMFLFLKHHLKNKEAAIAGGV